MIAIAFLLFRVFTTTFAHDDVTHHPLPTAASSNCSACDAGYGLQGDWFGRNHAPGLGVTEEVWVCCHFVQAICATMRKFLRAVFTHWTDSASVVIEIVIISEKNVIPDLISAYLTQ